MVIHRNGAFVWILNYKILLIILWNVTVNARARMLKKDGKLVKQFPAKEMFLKFFNSTNSYGSSLIPLRSNISSLRLWTIIFIDFDVLLLLYIYIYIVIIFFKWNSILKIILKILKIFFIKYFINNLTYKNFNKIKIIIVFYQHAWHFSFLVWLYLIDIN